MLRTKENKTSFLFFIIFVILFSSVSTSFEVKLKSQNNFEKYEVIKSKENIEKLGNVDKSFKIDEKGYNEENENTVEKIENATEKSKNFDESDDNNSVPKSENDINKQIIHPDLDTNNYENKNKAKSNIIEISEISKIKNYDPTYYNYK